jgi:hypothetical protein
MNNFLSWTISFVLMIITCIAMTTILALAGVPSIILSILAFALGWYWPLQKISEFIKNV